MQKRANFDRLCSCMIHIHTAVEEVTVTRLLAELDRKGKEAKKLPSFLKSKSIGRGNDSG